MANEKYRSLDLVPKNNSIRPYFHIAVQYFICDWLTKNARVTRKQPNDMLIY